MATMRFDESTRILRVLDQRRLPLEEKYVDLLTPQDVAFAIRDMTVRGAPLIGACAAYGMVQAAFLNQDLENCKTVLDATRPTAVNLTFATSYILKETKKRNVQSVSLYESALRAAKKLVSDEIESNAKMADYGCSLLRPIAFKARRLNVLHHCNTGGLATVGVGTALGVILTYFKESFSSIFVYVDETRPRLQGARLTSWELINAGVPHTIIADGAAGSVLSRCLIDAVLYGADRVALNGDVANKIGTYALSVVANENKVPCFAVMPTSTIDPHLKTGAGIVIEERDQDEVLVIDGQRVAPRGATAHNPAFDVTPNKFITAIITEAGICRAPYEESISKALAKVEAKNKASL